MATQKSNWQISPTFIGWVTRGQSTEWEDPHRAEGPTRGTPRGTTRPRAELCETSLGDNDQ